VIAIHADLLDFTAEPRWAGSGSSTGADDLHGVRFRPAHWLLVGDDGRILGAQPQEPGPGFQRHVHTGRLLMPGFLDTHVHGPQLDVIASWGTSLLDWLNQYTFPAERRHADPVVARAAAELFLDALLAHGTTSAVIFPTVHKASAEALFDAAAQRGMRVATGKVLMDRHAPDGLRDDVVHARADCEDLIERFHGRGRNRYAVTVRFAATSTPEQLAMAGELCRRHPGVFMQTHVAENTDEVRWIAELFPQARSYLDVYAQAGLLSERSVLAHGIWLDAADRRLLADTGAHIAHCPTSNLFLGSGLFDWQLARDANHGVSLATDVGGGTSLSMLRTAAAAYQVQALRGTRMSAWTLLHTATRGAAERLGWDSEIGSLEPGRLADVVLWDWAHGAVARHRDALAAHALHERVFAWLTLGDERNVAATYIAGQLRYRAQDQNPSPAGTPT
jgi:guanine deaminase